MSDISVSSYFLKLDGVQGESEHPGHENEIPVLSWGWGGTSTSTVGKTSGSGGSTVVMHPIDIVAMLDAGISKIGDFFAKGQHIAKGTLSAVKTADGQKDYLTINMTEVYISSFSVSGSGEVPVVNLTLTYKTINPKYMKQQADGSLVSTAAYTFDASTGKSS